MNVNAMWFQQDSTTRHTAKKTIDLLKEQFKDSIISRNGPVNWPPRSCDLTSLDCFMWGYLKSKVYADKPSTIDQLKVNIILAIDEIISEFLENMTKIGFKEYNT